MTNPSKNGKMNQPNPGSDKAVKQGCTCPILDNGYGDDELGKTRGFWIRRDCPLHDITSYMPGLPPTKEIPNE